MAVQIDVELPDGRTVHAYDSEAPSIALPVFWLHGTPGLGELPAPLLAAAAQRGLRWVSYDRPGYGGSTRRPGRNVAGATADIAAVADALHLDRFAALGASGGGPHALAAAVGLPDRIPCVVAIACPAPRSAAGLDFFAGMYPGGAAELHAADRGAEALAAHLRDAPDDPEMFRPVDREVLRGPWGWLGQVAGRAFADGPDGMVDDDVALVTPWGFDVAQIAVPTLLMHGAIDNVIPPTHAVRLAAAIPGAELRTVPHDGHVSVLTRCDQALDWIAQRRP